MIYALYGLAILTAVYIIYKIDWYTVKIMALSSTLKKLEKKNIQVKYKDVSEFLLPYNERPSTLAKLAEKEANA